MSTRVKIQHFILVFDRRAGYLVDQIDFGARAAAAVRKYEELEELHRVPCQRSVTKARF